MKQIVIKYGLIAGVILVIMIVTMMLMMGETSDFEKGESFGFVFIIGAFSMIYLGIREYRDKLSGGTINFNMGFRVGILITLIASTCYTIGWMVYFNFFDNSFLENYTAYYIEKVKSSGKTEQEITTEIAAFNKNMADYDNPLIMAMYTFLEVFPIGLIITLLCALLMRRRDPIVPEAVNN